MTYAVVFALWVLGFLVFEGSTTKNSETLCCDPSTNFDELPQDQFVNCLTDVCRYDRFVLPNTSTPFDVTAKVDINHLEAAQSQFTAYMTVQFTYLDGNLAFEELSPSRSFILGDETLKSKIWTPNVLLKDQEETTVVQAEEKEILVSIDNTGFVTYTYKMVAKFFCWMDLKKFPFDTQRCTLSFSDWSYNSSSLKFHWNNNSKGDISDNLHFTEFIFDSVDYFEDSSNGGPYQHDELSNEVGNFSELVIKFHFHRDIGYYLLDFFIPSYLLVCTAWVTFWLQADAGPPRATLGASTVVAFITLHLGVSKDIPKVSYVKASDIWFLGISCFIFFSLAEFAFVNVIWRRKKIIELKKPKHKYIIKAAVMPSVVRKDLRRYESSVSLSNGNQSNGAPPYENGLSQSVDSGNDSLCNGQRVISISDEEQSFGWTKMTPQEVAIWIDRKARIVFPIVFAIFNILYWVFVYYG